MSPKTLTQGIALIVIAASLLTAGCGTHQAKPVGPQLSTSQQISQIQSNPTISPTLKGVLIRQAQSNGPPPAALMVKPK